MNSSFVLGCDYRLMADYSFVVPRYKRARRAVGPRLGGRVDGNFKKKRSMIKGSYLVLMVEAGSVRDERKAFILEMNDEKYQADFVSEVVEIKSYRIVD